MGSECLHAFQSKSTCARIPTGLSSVLCDLLEFRFTIREHYYFYRYDKYLDYIMDYYAIQQSGKAFLIVKSFSVSHSLYYIRIGFNDVELVKMCSMTVKKNLFHVRSVCNISFSSHSQTTTRNSTFQRCLIYTMCVQLATVFTFTYKL